MKSCINIRDCNRSIQIQIISYQFDGSKFLYLRLHSLSSKSKLKSFQTMASSASSSKPKRKRIMEENALQEISVAPPSKRLCETEEKRISFKNIAPVHSTHQSNRYDVFINHCGPDVGNTVASVLYQFLTYLDLNVFLDSTDLQLGDSLPANIEHAIGSSSVHIAIFSKGYACTPRCLAELCLILNSGSKIIPLFHDVKPSDLATHAKSEKSMSMQWENALYNASLISGIEFDSSNGNLGHLCKNIVDTVFVELKEVQTKLKLEVADNLVGIEKPIEELESKISTSGNGIIVGIVGRAGIGKTTLAKEFFNRNRSRFYKSSFLFDVGAAHRTKNFVKMKEKLMSDVSMPLSISTTDSVDENLHFRSLIILDGIDHRDQLKAFPLNEFLNHGALVIVTCRDANVLQSFEMVKIYEMRELDSFDAKKLFCWHAFRQTDPPEGLDEFVELVVSKSYGLPSNLQMLGNNTYSLRNKTRAQV